MDYFLHLIAVSTLFALFAVNVDLVLGVLGIPAFGHAAFVLIGAYSSALCSVRLGLNPFLSILAGALVAALLGVMAALPTLRVGGDQLAIITIALCLVVQNGIRNVDFTGGPRGLSGVPDMLLLGVSFSRPGPAAVLGAIILVGVLWILMKLTSSPFGKVLLLVKADEIAAASLGKNARLFKVKSFCFSAALCGFGGGVYAHYIGYIYPGSFGVSESVLFVLMVYVGGAGTVWGPAIGAFVLIIMPEALRFVGLPSNVAALVKQLLFGLLLTSVVLLRPHGIVKTRAQDPGGL